MATGGENCRICSENLPKKYRRTIFSPTFGVNDQLNEVLGYIPNESDGHSKYVCGYCFAKLNKLSKIDHDLVNRLSVLKSEKHCIVSELRMKHGDVRPQPETVNTRSPVKVTPSAKRPLVERSPTPRKVKKPLVFLSPSRRPTTERKLLPKCILPNVQEDETLTKRKKYGVTLSPGKVKVLVRGQSTSKLRSKTISTQSYQRILKNIAFGCPKDRLGRIIYNSPLKSFINKAVISEVKRECNILCSRKNPSLLRNISCDNMTSFHLEDMESEIKTRAPLLHGILQEIVKESVLGIACSSAVLFKFRNQQMSSLHHIVSQILDKGGATDEVIDTIAKLGLCVSSSATYKQKLKLREKQEQKKDHLLMSEKRALELYGQTDDEVSSDIIGDNIDITRSPSQMTIDKRRKSWHWFLLIALQKRIIGKHLDDSVPISEIEQVDNSTFVPNFQDCQTMDKNFIYHINNVLVKYLDCFKKYKDCIPKYIPHPHLTEMALKSDFTILDILDKSENKSDDMISILEFIHENYIPRTEEDRPNIIQKKVFGGDVLTNERAYSAQLAMLNGETDFERLSGVIHRPEGLHRMMNLLLLIYQIFYKQSSAGDRGSLCQLRNIVSRIDVRGSDEVIQKYRAHYSFMDDCLDSYIVAACMHLLEMQDINDTPKRRQPLFESLPEDEQYKFISTISKEIVDRYVNISDDLTSLSEETKALDTQSKQLQSMYDSERKIYVCENCDRQYKTTGGLKKHLKTEHEWQFIDAVNLSSSQDHIAIYRACFMKCSLLLRDINDAYKMGDGDRILLTTKFQMLLSHVGSHTKYKLWLFRFMAYCFSLLTPKMAYEYLWNCTANLQGSIGHNIPNDNLVELLVQAVKKKIYAQGANATFQSVRNATLTLQTQEEIMTNIQTEVGKKTSGKRRPETSKVSDVNTMVNELLSAQVFENISGREYSKFQGFKDVFSRIKIKELHEWITMNKKRISYEMI